MHFVSPSQLLPARIPGPFLSSLSPLRFLLQLPLGFLLIPIYSIFYKSL